MLLACLVMGTDLTAGSIDNAPSEVAARSNARVQAPAGRSIAARAIRRSKQDNPRDIARRALLTPRDEQACVGSRVMFSLPEAGPDVRYQWMKDGQSIPGATGRALIFPAVAGEDAGVYTVSVVAEGRGPSVAVVARLDVSAGPSILRQPEDRVVAAGGGAIFEVETSGSDLTYQWCHNGVAIPDATNRSYIIPAAGAADAGSYSVIVSSPDCLFGGSQSRPAMLNVVDDLSAVETAGVDIEMAGAQILATATVEEDASISSGSDQRVRAIGISPNPAAGIATLQLADGGAGRLSVFDPTGRLMFEREARPTAAGVLPIETRNLVDGVYFCRFVDAKGTESVGRLVVVH